MTDTITTMTAALALLGVAIGSSPANASACGVQYWNPVTFAGVTVPGGQLTHCIEGQGYHVDTDGANFISAGNVCDSSVRFTYGNGARHIDGNLNPGCSHANQTKLRINQNMPRGSACAELWGHNWRLMIARQCHYISP